jgi:hypothetical protein
MVAAAPNAASATIAFPETQRKLQGQARGRRPARLKAAGDVQCGEAAAARSGRTGGQPPRERDEAKNLAGS